MFWSIIKYFWRSFLWALIVLNLSIMHVPNSVSHWHFLQNFPVDKIVHTIFYFFLTFLLIDGFLRFLENKKNIFLPYFYAILISSLYGGMIELIQKFLLTNRYGDIFDFIFNLMGMFFALFLYNPILKILPNFCKKY